MNKEITCDTFNNIDLFSKLNETLSEIDKPDDETILSNIYEVEYDMMPFSIYQMTLSNNNQQEVDSILKRSDIKMFLKDSLGIPFFIYKNLVYFYTQKNNNSFSNQSSLLDIENFSSKISKNENFQVNITNILLSSGEMSFSALLSDLSDFSYSTNLNSNAAYVLKFTVLNNFNQLHSICSCQCKVDSYFKITCFDCVNEISFVKALFKKFLSNINFIVDVDKKPQELVTYKLVNVLDNKNVVYKEKYIFNFSFINNKLVLSITNQTVIKDITFYEYNRISSKSKSLYKIISFCNKQNSAYIVNSDELVFIKDVCYKNLNNLHHSNGDSLFKYYSSKLSGSIKLVSEQLLFTIVKYNDNNRKEKIEYYPSQLLQIKGMLCIKEKNDFVVSKLTSLEENYSQIQDLMHKISVFLGSEANLILNNIKLKPKILKFPVFTNNTNNILVPNENNGMLNLDKLFSLNTGNLNNSFSEVFCFFYGFDLKYDTQVISNFIDNFKETAVSFSINLQINTLFIHKNAEANNLFSDFFSNKENLKFDLYVLVFKEQSGHNFFYNFKMNFYRNFPLNFKIASQCINIFKFKGYNENFKKLILHIMSKKGLKIAKIDYDKTFNGDYNNFLRENKIMIGGYFVNDLSNITFPNICQSCTSLVYFEEFLKKTNKIGLNKIHKQSSKVSLEIQNMIKYSISNIKPKYIILFRYLNIFNDLELLITNEIANIEKIIGSDVILIVVFITMDRDIRTYSVESMPKPNNLSSCTKMEISFDQQSTFSNIFNEKVSRTTIGHIIEKDLTFSSDNLKSFYLLSGYSISLTPTLHTIYSNNKDVLSNTLMIEIIKNITFILSFDGKFITAPLRIPNILKDAEKMNEEITEYLGEEYYKEIINIPI